MNFSIAFLLATAIGVALMAAFYELGVSYRDKIQEEFKEYKETPIGRSTKYKMIKLRDNSENNPCVTRHCTFKRNHNY